MSFRNTYLLLIIMILAISVNSAWAKPKTDSVHKQKKESQIQVLDNNTFDNIKSDSDVEQVYKLYFKKYMSVSAELKKWIDSQLEGKRKNISVGSDMTNLWESYKKSASFTKRWLADFGRVWVYDAALGLYASLCINDFNTAKMAVDNFMELIRAEKKKGYKGLFHFSYNTRGDDFIDPREPQGATQWALKSMYAYMLQSGDLTHFDELTGYLRNDILPMQILDKNHPAYGFLRAGYMHPEGLSQGGYNIYQEIDSLNSLSHNVTMEHNADYIDLLRLVALVYDKYKDKITSVGDDFRTELRYRHALCMRAALKWNKNSYWPTGFDEQGNPNWSKAVDHYSWLGCTFIGVKNNRDLPWKSIQVLNNEFSTTVKSIKLLFGEKEVAIILPEQAKGSIFFDKSFADQFVDISPAQRSKLAVMIQPEATGGVIVALTDFALRTKSPKRRKFALKYLDELLSGLATIHEAYNKQEGYKGGGMPYATEFIHGYFGPDPSMAASATYFVALNKLYSGYGYFIGVQLPKGFENALIEKFEPAPIVQSIELPDYVREELKNKLTGSKTTLIPEEIENQIEIKEFKLDNGQIHLNLSYPVKYMHNLELIVFAKTDKWYVQPRNIYSSKAGQDLPQPDISSPVKCFNKNLSPDNTLAIIANRDNDLKKDSSLSDFEMEQYFGDGLFIKGASAKGKVFTKTNKSDLSNGL